MKESIESLSVYTELLGQPDEEYFWFIENEDKRKSINRQLGFIWDYSPGLWDKFTSIDEYFRFVADKIQTDRGYRRTITYRAKRIREILGR